MKLIKNSGTARIVDELGAIRLARPRLQAVTPSMSLFALHALQRELSRHLTAQIILPEIDPRLGGPEQWGLFGEAADRPSRNRFLLPFLAAQLHQLLAEKAELRTLRGSLQQGLLLLGDGSGPLLGYSGSCALSSSGIGLHPPDGFSMIHATETPQELQQAAQLFATHWSRLRPDPTSVAALQRMLSELSIPLPPSLAVGRVLEAIFGSSEGVDEEKILREGTGLQSSVVWKKLYRFQRDGVLGVIDKLERFGGCILADSVGLGKTFEALAVVKYYELRNHRVLVLCPKRLRDNWTQYRANDRRNLLANDRFHYDVLNHTDLGREQGRSGDIDLSHINWGNYDLVVIDESHNFRNRPARKDGRSRYDFLMDRLLRDGVRTRVLMLSATPVNNRLADLKNQLAFATEGRDAALAEHGIPSIEATTRLAQTAFNQWLKLPEPQRTTGLLLEGLGFDYFKLLDLLTIARSRRHVERYYGTTETGRFPERLCPINLKPEVDTAGNFRTIKEINQEIRRLNLSVYAPMRYVLPEKKKQYEARYSTSVRGGKSAFQQSDREESLVHLLRVNVLKRMESSVQSFGLTLRRLIADVEQVLSKLDRVETELSGFEPTLFDINDNEWDDPRLEGLWVGTKVRVLLTDVDVLRWRQDLSADLRSLGRLLDAAEAVDAAHDAKLAELQRIILQKINTPINPGNRKVLVFTAFADTAAYLYQGLSSWAAGLKLQLALVTGTGQNRCTLPGLRTDMSSLLSAFSPLSKERHPDLASEGELDILVATDCISEGQNLQDCDTLINYDIHWNPVRIIQRFGRIDRLGSKNTKIQLINFWPNLELEEYINLEQRVTGRMVLLDVSATGEENLIEQAAEDPMNDLAYRRRQLLQLQERVVDIEEAGIGLTLADISLSELRADLSRARKRWGDRLATLPFGLYSVLQSDEKNGIPAGFLFCLRVEGEAATALAQRNDPTAPYLLSHVDLHGQVRIPHTQPKAVLDLLQRIGQHHPDHNAVPLATFEASTRRGEHMDTLVAALSTAVAAMVGRQQQRGITSLFSPGGTHVLRGEFSGMDDIEVVAAFWVFPSPEAT